jgi:hypothetical protein
MDFIFHKEIKEIGKKEMRILTGGDNDSPHTHVMENPDKTWDDMLEREVQKAPPEPMLFH